jgi:hypothetical protein
MSKVQLFLHILLIALFFIPSSISTENTNNTNMTNETISQSENETLETHNFEEEDPFKKIDFGNLINLNDTNMTDAMKKYDILYMCFYATWSQESLQFLPEYVNISRYAEENKLDVKFARIDVGECLHVPDEFKLEDYPTIYLVLKEEKHLYQGERTRDGLLKFIRRKQNNDVYAVSTLDEIKEYTKNSSFVLLSTLRHEETVLYQSFLNYSKTAINIEFLSCLSDECVKEYRQDIILFKKFDEKINKYTIDVGLISEAKIDSVKEFFGAFAIETGGVLTNVQIDMMFEYKRRLLFYFRNSSLEEQTKADKLIKELGKDYRKKNIYTCVSDIEGSPIFENVARTFVMVPQDLPALLLYSVKSNAPNGMPNIYSLRPIKKEQMTKEFINDYIDQIDNKKIKNDLFSEPPRKDYNVNGLKYIIGRNYDKDVIEEKNNVLINIIEENMYCPECFTIMDIMRNMTKKYKVEDKKIIFSYMDVGRNQPRGIALENETAPLLLLYANTLPEKKIIKMKMDNWTEISEDHIVDFLSENLNWGLPKKVKEKPKKSEEKKDEPKKDKVDDKKEEQKKDETENKKEAKKEAQTDL